MIKFLILFIIYVYKETKYIIHPYDEYYLDIAQNKLVLMFEIAVYQEKMNIDDFSKKFIESEICQRLEKADPIYLAEKICL